MGRLFVVNLEGKIYSCKHCRTHLALCEDVVSKSFHCRHGKAYLFSKSQLYVLFRYAEDAACISLADSWPLSEDVNDLFSECLVDMDHCSSITFMLTIDHLSLTDSVNVSVGEKEERLMMTGMHTVADIFCVGCGSIVGWKYETAHEKSQKYKEGKSVLERFKVSGPDGSNYWVSHEAHVGGSDADDA
ncbi:hypothetical protein CUMW_051720 [Citrus unshiu]|nr:hypothetical protein CUMW_051720 [Citrus unshiu]GAY40412.1 hypothetical protein CUMW_051720 [Citrus unshiu]